MIFGQSKAYERAIFPPEVLEEAISEFERIVASAGDEIFTREISYTSGSSQTRVEAVDENYRRVAFNSSGFEYWSNSKNTSRRLSLRKGRLETTVSINGIRSLSEADRIISIFDKSYSSYVEPPEDTLKKITVFIGHGRSRLWRDLKDHLHDLHEIDVVAYETGARAGLTIQEVLQDMASKASIAFLVLTAEDIDRDGVAHARENVVHETGLFQGRLGFKRAIVLLEEGCNEFSNIAGLQQLRFRQGNIREIFGDVLAVVRREFTGDR